MWLSPSSELPITHVKHATCTEAMCYRWHRLLTCVCPDCRVKQLKSSGFVAAAIAALGLSSQAQQAPQEPIIVSLTPLDPATSRSKVALNPEQLDFGWYTGYLASAKPHRQAGGASSGSMAAAQGEGVTAAPKRAAAANLAAAEAGQGRAPESAGGSNQRDMSMPEQAGTESSSASTGDAVKVNEATASAAALRPPSLAEKALISPVSSAVSTAGTAAAAAIVPHADSSQVAANSQADDAAEEYFVNAKAADASVPGPAKTSSSNTAEPAAEMVKPYLAQTQALAADPQATGTLAAESAARAVSTSALHQQGAGASAFQAQAGSASAAEPEEPHAAEVRQGGSARLEAERACSAAALPAVPAAGKPRWERPARAASAATLGGGATLARRPGDAAAQARRNSALVSELKQRLAANGPRPSVGLSPLVRPPANTRLPCLLQVRVISPSYHTIL